MPQAQCPLPCKRIPFRFDVDALRPGKQVSHKCLNCKTVTILEGTAQGTLIKTIQAVRGTTTAAVAR